MVRRARRALGWADYSICDMGWLVRRQVALSPPHSPQSKNAFISVHPLPFVLILYRVFAGVSVT
jgi:hypothetical protein